jgi:hypothetical protein
MLRAAAASLMALATLSAQAPPAPRLAPADRVIVREAFRLSRALGTRVWPTWNRAPFALLLVTADHEFLFNHPAPTGEFTALRGDAWFSGPVLARPRTFDTNLQATFEAVGGVSTVVIGRPGATQAPTPARWVLVAQHEHFHQLQDSWPDFHADARALGLARGDETGMWMLNYPFPYGRADLNVTFAQLGARLRDALDAPSGPILAARTREYLELRRKVQNMLDEDDYKYLSFQIWKEGIARYIEIRMAAHAARYRATPEFRALPGASFAEAERDLRSELHAQLDDVRLADRRRTAFYAFGAGEGLLLDRARPSWADRYFREKFFVERYFE